MKPSLEHKAQLYHQLYVGIKANLPFHVVIDPQRIPQAFHSPLLSKVPLLLQKGRPLSAILAFARMITPWEAAMIKIGEDAGRLDGVLADLEIFFVARYQQYKALSSKLIYPALTFAVAVVAGPLPALAMHKISGGEYFFGAVLKCALLYAAYQLLVVRAIERSAAGAVDPLLVRLAMKVQPDHWIRQMFEVGYLNLLILCLASGIDAVSALRMLQGLVPGERLFQQHGIAINQVQTRGVTLTQALVGSGIILNSQIGSFLHNSEVAGTLHSDMKQYLARRNTEMNLLFKHKMKVFGNWLYVAVMLAAVFVFSAGMGGNKKANPFIATPERIQQPASGQ